MNKVICPSCAKPNSKKVEVFKAKTVEITTSSKVHFQVDGEYIGKIKKVSAKILESQLNLLLPTIPSKMEKHLENLKA